MYELVSQVLLVGAIAVSVKIIAVCGKRLGISPLLAILPLGVLFGPTVINLFGAPVLPGSELHEGTILQSLMKILIELGFIQLIFAAGTATDFDRYAKYTSLLYLIGVSRFFLSAALSIAVLKLFGASWPLALAAGAILSVGSAALYGQAKQPSDEVDSLFRGTALVSFILGTILVVVATGLPLDATYGAPMTVVAIVYFLLKVFLLTGAAFVLGRWYVEGFARRAKRTPSLQGVIGFAILFALFYGWAAWSVGLIASLPVAFVFGNRFAQSNFEIKDRVISGLSRKDSWLISFFFLSFGLSTNLLEIRSRLAIFVALFAATIAGKFIGAYLGELISGKRDGKRIWRFMGTQAAGEVGLLLAVFAYGRGALVPDIFTVVIAIITITTFTAPVLAYFDQSGSQSKGLVSRTSKDRLQAAF